VGSTGYIGSHTARGGRRHGFDAVLTIIFQPGHALLIDGFKLILGDIPDKKALTNAMRGTDAVIHFAAPAHVGESFKNPRKYFESNLEGAFALLNTSVDARVRYLVFSSSCTV
jgi:UDP-glucose 4-epimerase